MSITMRMMRGGAVMTSALFCGSAQTMALRSATACAEVPPPVIGPCTPAAPATAWTMPVICSLSLGAIFSASA